MLYSELKERYKTNINYFHYMGLIQAIPTRYKQILLENKKGVYSDNIDRIMQQKEKVVKLIYETNLERNKQFPEKASLRFRHYWKLKLQEIISLIIST